MTIDCIACGGGGVNRHADGVSNCEVCGGDGVINIQLVVNHIAGIDGLCRRGRRFLIVEVTNHPETSQP